MSHASDSHISRALSRDPKIRLGSSVAPSGGCTQSERETLDILLATHFPNSVAIEREAVSAAAHHAKRLDWRVAVGVVSYGRVVWVIGSFTHTKVLVWMGYSHLCYTRDGRSLSLT
jgi:hypothetical protein